MPTPGLYPRKTDGRLFYVGADGTVREPTPDELKAAGKTQPIPVKQPLRFTEVSEREGVASGRQRLIHDLLALNPDQQVKFMEAEGFQMRRDKTGRAFYRMPNTDSQWKMVDPKGFDRGDAANVAGQLALSAAPGVGSASLGLRGWRALGMLGGGAAAVELARQGAGQLAGVPGNMDPARAVTEGALAAALPPVITGAVRAGKAGVRLATRGTRRLEAPAMSIAAKAAGLSDKGSIQAEEALAFRMGNRQDVQDFTGLAKDFLGHLDTLVPQATRAHAIAQQRGSVPVDMRQAITTLTQFAQKGPVDDAGRRAALGMRNELLDRLMDARGIASPAAKQRLARNPVALRTFLRTTPARDALIAKEYLDTPANFKDAAAIPDMAFKSQAAKEARNKVSTAIRASMPPQYAKLMDEASAILGAREMARKDLVGARDTLAPGKLQSAALGTGGGLKLENLQRIDRLEGTNFSNRLRETSMGAMFGGKGGQPETRPFLTAGGGLRGPALAVAAAKAATGGAVGGAAGGAFGGPGGAALGALIGGTGLAMTTPRGVVRTASKVAQAQRWLERLGSGGTVPMEERALAQLLLPILTRQSGAAAPMTAQGESLLDALMSSLRTRQESDLLQGGE